jgi:hypothetical protein
MDMRELKFLAGLGTILIFIGIYSMRGAFVKTITKEGDTIPLKRSAKATWLLTGVVCFVAGVFLLIKSFRGLMTR